MNNMNKARIRTTWMTISTTVLMLTFGLSSHAEAQVAKTQEAVVYSKEVLYVNKYVNLVNIKNIINIDIKKKNDKTVYLINDLATKSSFTMPSYSKLLNLKSRVDKRVIISRLANGLLSVETGGPGAYYRKSYSSSANGAFQWMPSTWNNYMGYKQAIDAPEWIQDKRIVEDLNYRYSIYHDWEKVIAAHLYPAYASNKGLWNKKIPGNPTINQYVKNVFKHANIIFN